MRIQPLNITPVVKNKSLPQNYKKTTYNISAKDTLILTGITAIPIITTEIAIKISKKINRKNVSL